MRLSCFIDDNLGEMLSLEKFALSCLASWDDHRYSFYNLFFDPLFDCHEVMELVRFEFCDSSFEVFHQCSFVSIRKPLFIEFENLFLFFLLLGQVFIFFLTIIVIILSQLRLRLFALYFALGLDASEACRGLLFFFLIFVFFFLAIFFFISLSFDTHLISVLLILRNNLDLALLG